MKSAKNEKHCETPRSALSGAVPGNVRPSSAVVRRTLRKTGDFLDYSTGREFKRDKNEENLVIGSTLDAIEQKMNRANEVYNLNLLSK